MCIGANMYLIAIVVTALMISVQLIFKSDSFRHFPKTTASLLIRVEKGTSIRDIDDAFKSLGYLCLDVRLIKDNDNDGRWIILTEVVSQKDIEPEHLLSEMRKKDFIQTIELH